MGSAIFLPFASSVIAIKTEKYNFCKGSFRALYHKYKVRIEELNNTLLFSQFSVKIISTS
jgi:hypothetical protein